MKEFSDKKIKVTEKKQKKIIRIIAEILFYLAGIKCGWYSTVIYRVHSGSAFFLVWDVLGLFFIIMGLALRFKLAKKLPKWFKVAFGGIVSVVLILILIIYCFVRTGYREESTDNMNVDYLIVLGAQVRADGPSIVLRYRLDRAAEYLETNPQTICVVSGGKGSNEIVSEAEAMKTYLVEKGISADRIIMEDKSTSTKENMRFSRALIPDGSTVGVVTNNFHMYRSLLIAEKNGIENPKGIAAGSVKRYEANNILREICAVAREWVTK